MLKKIIYLIVSGGLLLSGCSLDYEPLNGPSSGSFPASEEEAMAGLYAAYKGLANMTVKETPFPMRINDCISDIGTYRTGAGNQIKAMSSTLTADNTMCEKVYKTVYKIAGRVHLVLDNLDRLRGVIPEDRFNQIKAELLCIRAYYYDLGCQFYGDIPFIDHQLDLDDYSDYPRIPREQVTARLLQDLDDDLLDYLPVQWNPGTYGTTRIGRVAAYALKARIALNWGLWEEAARCSKIATTLAEGVYDLEPLDCTYYATHADGEPSAANLFGFAGQTSREWLWAIQYNRLINYTSATYYEAPRIHGGCSWLGPSQAMIDTFQCTDGKPITESPLYDWQNPWANRDPRLDLFCLRPDTRLWGVQYDTDVRVEKVKDYNQSTAGKEVLISNADAVGNKSEYAANGSKGPGGYLWRKYSDKGMMGLVNGTKTEDDINAGIIRFAELLLIEADGHGETTDANILAVRKRFDELYAQYKPLTEAEAEEVRTAGGLFIIGTERHESRRIDNQLRGRAGRQGDPGETRFYISLEDDLMRLFGGDRIQNMMEKFDLDEDTPIENKMLTKAIENAQTTVESRNFQSRKSVLEYDDVMNKQREIIYDQRKQVLDGKDLKETILNMMHTAISNHVAMAFGEKSALDMAGYREMMRSMDGLYFPQGTISLTEEEVGEKSEQDFVELLTDAASKTYEAKETEITAPIMRELERVIMLRVVDEYWMDHIDAMDDLKQGIRLRAYGNTDPVIAYKQESLTMFEEMVAAIQDETVRRLFSVRLKKDEEVKRERVAKGMVENVGGDGTAPKKQPVKSVKIGRNDPCPCGSGLKWKKCTCKEYHDN